MVEDDVVEIGADGTFDLTSQPPAAAPEPPKPEPAVETSSTTNAAPAPAPAPSTESEEVPTKSAEDEDEDNSPPRKLHILRGFSQLLSSCWKWRKN